MIRLPVAALVVAVVAVTWRGTIEVAGAITILITAALAVSRFPPVRFVWRKVIAEPYWAAHRHQTLELVEPVAQAVSVLAEETRKGRERLHQRLDEISEDLARHDAGVKGRRAPRRSDDPDDADYEQVRGEIPPYNQEG